MWVVLFAVVILVVLDVVSSGDGAEDVDTSKMVAELKSGDVKEVTFIDGDQTHPGNPPQRRRDYIAMALRAGH